MLEPQYQQLLERELSSGKLRDADALVWDLRDGWGGAEAEYLHLFTGRAPITTLINRDGRKSVANVSWRKPVAMLVNGGTRSGKEILAYGFKEYGVGEVIGNRTAGAVLAGRAYLLSDGSLVLVAVADVLVDGRAAGRCRHNANDLCAVPITVCPRPGPTTGPSCGSPVSRGWRRGITPRECRKTR